MYFICFIIEIVSFSFINVFANVCDRLGAKKLYQLDF